MCGELPKVVLIGGPTASGKSALALRVAQALNGEIVSIDSVQVYRGCDIGSAKPTLSEQARIPHHLLDIFSPDELCDAGVFLEKAKSAILDVAGRGKLPVLTGGTNMYITSLLHGLVSGARRDAELRERLEHQSSEELKAELLRLDPARAERIHLHDRVRLIRALEIAASGVKASSILSEHAHSERYFDATMVCLCPERSLLLRRIAERARQMLEAGLVAETRALLNRFGPAIQPFRSLGYAEALSFIQGKIHSADLLEQITVHTRQFAKRQMTYWRNEPKKRGWLVPPVQAAGDRQSEKRAAQAVKLPTEIWSFEKLIQYLGEELAQPREKNSVLYLERLDE